MLLLTRKTNQKIIIADGEIKIIVLSIQGNKVKFGIEAPNHIKVHREEVYQKIQQEKQPNTQCASEDISEPKLLDDSDNLYAIDLTLIEQVRTGDANAQFQLGKILYEQSRYGFAKKFLGLALEQGMLEAKPYLSIIDYDRLNFENKNSPWSL